KKNRRFEPSQVTAQQDSHRLNKFAIGALERFPSRKSLQSADTHCATTEGPRCYQSVLLSSRLCDARHHTGTAPRVTSLTTSPSPHRHYTTTALDDDIPVNAVRDTTAVSALSTPRPTTSSQRSTPEQDIRLCAHPQTRPRAEAPVPSGPASPRPVPSAPPH